VRVRTDCFGAACQFRDERCAEAGPFEFVVLRRVVELALGQLVERDAHDSDPFSNVSKHLVGRPRRNLPGRYGGRPPLGFFSPDLAVLFRREFVEALKQSAGKPGAPLRIQPKGFCLKFFDSHASILRRFSGMGDLFRQTTSVSLRRSPLGPTPALTRGRPQTLRPTGAAQC
jgi:hypothetical protein